MGARDEKVWNKSGDKTNFSCNPINGIYIVMSTNLHTAW